MGIVIGIDVGGSTTKIVGFRVKNGKRELISPQLVKANDPLTATYGAFGKFTDENNIAISDIDKVIMTGVGSSYVKRDLYGIECVRVPEFDCIGRGGTYLSGLDDAIVVSMGTGTAIVHAKDGCMKYLGGTGVGGGPLLGLSKLLVGAEDVGHISEYAHSGDLGNVDLRIKDMTASGAEPVMNADMTAANFGNVSDVATKQDIAKGIANLVYETVGMVSIFASRSVGVTDIVLTGNLTRLDSCAAKFEEFNHLGYGVRFTIPELAEFSTAIGCAISAFNLDNIH
ncbi:MAG: pantothenate kinase [Clostridia bacterium]|nr:pantothenate kinase [Clostridia bacterium]